MKKLLTILYTLGLISSAYSLETAALPPREGNVRMEVGIGYIVDRELKSSEDRSETDLSSTQILLKPGYNPVDHLSIYAIVGLADAGLKGRGREPLAFLYGGGVTVSMFDPVEPHNILLDGQIDYFKPDKYTVMDYQFAMFYTYRSNNVIPFAGIKFSETLLKDKEAEQKWKGKNKIGIIIGLHYFVNPNVFFSAEMHNFDHDAIYGGAGLSF